MAQYGRRWGKYPYRRTCRKCGQIKPVESKFSRVCNECKYGKKGAWNNRI